MNPAWQGRNQMLNHGGISRNKAQEAQKWAFARGQHEGTRMTSKSRM